jgi:hypothetical protein
MICRTNGRRSLPRSGISEIQRHAATPLDRPLTPARFNTEAGGRAGGDGHRNTHRDAGREDKVAVVNARGHAGGGVGGAAETA